MACADTKAPCPMDAGSACAAFRYLSERIDLALAAMSAASAGGRTSPDGIKTPPLVQLWDDDGRLRNQRYPKFWRDLPVRDAVIARHRQQTVAKAVAQLVAEFGMERAPSKSALHRFWRRMDEARGLALRADNR